MNGDNISVILARFPKVRPAMSPKEEDAHVSIMRRNRERVTLFTRVSDALESWMHREAARREGLPMPHTLLEIGGGMLNHLPFEPADIPYDVIEPESEMYRDSPDLRRVRTMFDDIREIDLQHRYERIVSIATLEHLTELPYTLASAGLLLAPGGVFRCGIPSEGGFLWALSWRTIAVDLYLRTGHNWAEHMRFEHINTAPEIIALIRYFFRRVAIRRFPLPLHHLSFYVAIEAREPDLDRCRAYRASR
jgi:hypothetical protein